MIIEVRSMRSRKHWAIYVLLWLWENCVKVLNGIVA